MDTGKSFSKKTLSREPIERIQKIQAEMLANLKKNGGAIHLVGRYDNITSRWIPGIMLALSVPMYGYCFYVLVTQNATNT